MEDSFPRRTALAAGTVTMLVNGVIYAWSIYSLPFGEGFGWTSAQLGMCFTVTLGCFCLGGAAGGAIAAKLGVGFSIPAGGALAFLGYMLCIFLQAERLWLLYAAFALSGTGIGFIYNGVLSAVVPRFPDKRGFASGLLLLGFGMGSLVMGTAASRLIVSPVFGWHLTYILTGLLIFASAIIGRFFVLPPETPRAGRSAPESGLTPGQMLSTARFWLFFAAALIATGCGSGVIAHASYILAECGAPPGTATLAVGLVSVMNGLGRIGFGALHDRFGFRVSLALDTALYAVCGALAASALRMGAVSLLAAAMMVIGACYGGVPVIAASVAQEFFGEAHYGRNLGIINLNILPAAFASAIAGGIDTATGSYAGALALFSGLGLVSLVLTAALSRMKDTAH